MVFVCSLLALIIPVFGLFNAIIIGLVSLRVGVNSGMLLSGISSAVVAIGILALGIMPEQSKGQEILAIGQWVISLVALVALCGLLRYTRSLQFSMLSALVAGVTVLLGFRLLISDTTAWWQSTSLKEVFNGMVETVMAQQSMVDHQMMEGVSATLAGLFVAAFLASLFIHLYLSRSWQAAIFNPGGFKEEFARLYYGRKPAIAAVLFFIIWRLLGAENLIGFVSLAGIWLMGMMYTFYGIAVMCGVFKAKKLHLGFLFGGMVVAWIVASLMLQGGFGQSPVVAMVLLMLIVASIGFVDTFVDFRKRLESQTTE